MSSDTFELTMQEPPRMNQRLDDLADLAGETILATFDECDSKDGQFVIVTENRNWLVIDADTDTCGDPPYVEVVKGVYGRIHTLVDFVEPKRLFAAGCINADVYQALQAKEDADAAALNAKRVAGLRAQLAKLEGSA